MPTVKYELLLPSNGFFLTRKCLFLALIFSSLLCAGLIFFSGFELGLEPLCDSVKVLETPHTTIANMNNLRASPNGANDLQRVLILTPLKDASKYLDTYFVNLERMSYPKHLTSLAFLVSDTSDDTVDKLTKYAEMNGKRRNPLDRYERISVFVKDFNFDLPGDQRHKYELQPLRRSYLAKARNYLLTAALNAEHSWVLWLDVDVVLYDKSIIEDLMSVDADVVVPNCLLNREDGEFWGYDKNNWQETKESKKLQKTLDENYVLVEGYYEFPTHRKYMVDMPTHLGRLKPVPLDGVGATFTLVKAAVHREGANFPPYAFQHEIETEGFAKMAKRMGFEVVGLPGYIIYHEMND